jgi:IclR family transcriptional regulator, acetate operon repressor
MSRRPFDRLETGLIAALADEESDLTKSRSAGPKGREPGAPALGASAVASRSDHVQSLVRALGIINQLAAAEEGATLTHLAERVGLAPSTAHRLLTTLEQERYVHFDHERRLWSVGVQAFVAGAAFLRTRNLVGIARPYMRVLMNESTETVNLAIEDEYEAVYLAQVECRQMMRALARPGARVPLYCSSVGKAILSAMPESDLDKALPRQGMRRLTDKTITRKAALRDELALTRERGFAIDDEEHAFGLRCVASLVFDEWANAIAAISISGPTARISNERIASLGKLVRLKADEVTVQLGGALPEWRKAR